MESIDLNFVNVPFGFACISPQLGCHVNFVSLLYLVTYGYICFRLSCHFNFVNILTSSVFEFGYIYLLLLGCCGACSVYLRSCPWLSAVLVKKKKTYKEIVHFVVHCLISCCCCRTFWDTWTVIYSKFLNFLFMYWCRMFSDWDRKLNYSLTSPMSTKVGNFPQFHVAHLWQQYHCLISGHPVALALLYL